MQQIEIIQGKVTIPAATIKALVLNAGGRVRTVQWTDALCTLEMSRGEWTEQFTYTIDDAKKQGLSGKDNWQRMPKQMLYARCVSILGRNMYADILSGFYAREEIDHCSPRLLAQPAEPTCPVLTPDDPEKPADLETLMKLYLAFEKLGVPEKALEARLGHPLDQTTLLELAELREAYRAIKGGAPAVEFFSVESLEAPACAPGECEE
jgi:hypothetical protein